MIFLKNYKLTDPVTRKVCAEFDIDGVSQTIEITLGSDKEVSDMQYLLEAMLDSSKPPHLQRVNKQTLSLGD
jgi:hypothetical protein